MPSDLPAPTPTPQRRVSDPGHAAREGVWGAIDELRANIRMLAPSATLVAQHELALDALKDSLTRHEQLVREGFERSEKDAAERFNRAFLKLDDINDHVQRTNGRVSALETAKAVEEALRQAKAEAVEVRRKNIALSVATHGWIKPAAAAFISAVLVFGLGKL